MVDDPGELLADGDDLANNCTNGLGKQGVVNFGETRYILSRGMAFKCADIP